ncbi:MAG: DUF4232 domain-containing protein [Chloroflexota bacterium]
MSQGRSRVTAISVLVAYLLLSALWEPAAASTATSCRFVLGFAALQALIPGVVGACLDDEQHNPANGDALQDTTNGLLVWRKADNFTAFTDGYWTWMNGPFGLQERLNSQRFSWEANPTGLPIIPVAVPPPLGRCHSGDLVISQRHGQVAVGNVGVSFQFRSIAAQPCTLYGFPGIELLDTAAQPLPTFLTWRTSGYLIGTVPEQTLVLKPGDSVYFVLEFTDVPTPGQRCLEATNLRITPPNAYNSVVGQVHGIAPCGGRITASPVLATDPLAPNNGS